MPGADIVTVAVHDDKTVEIADRFATQKALPEEDGCSHWTLISATEASGMTTVEITRLLDTGDEQDRPFTPGLMKVKLHQISFIDFKIIYAYGTSDTFGYHGDNRFFSSVTFIPGAPLPKSDPSWKSIDLAVTYKVISSLFFDILTLIGPILNNYVCLYDSRSQLQHRRSLGSVRSHYQRY